MQLLSDTNYHGDILSPTDAAHNVPLTYADTQLRECEWTRSGTKEHGCRHAHEHGKLTWLQMCTDALKRALVETHARTFCFAPEQSVSLVTRVRPFVINGGAGARISISVLIAAM